MTRTLIIVDPMGTNLMSLGLQYLLLKGTLVQPGDVVYRLPYTNMAGASNIAGGVTALQNKLTSTSGDIFVFAYSEGAQVVYKWLRDHGTTSPVTPTSRLKFLLIGNAERRYGGFAYKHQNLSALCDVDGLPDPLSDGTSTVHYEVTDFARQYDGLADCPSAQDIQDVIDSVAAFTSDPLTWALRALQDVANALIGAHRDAALNALMGAQMVHTNYFLVTPDDRHNVRFTDPDHPLVEYVWSPTYPVPLLGMGSTFPSLDREKRKSIETAFSRPVVMPQPNYAQISLFTTDYFATDEDFRRVEETGWWPEFSPPHVSFALSLTPSLGMDARVPALTGYVLSLTPSLGMDAVGVGGLFTRDLELALTPDLAMSAIGMGGVSTAEFELALTPDLGIVSGGSITASFELPMTPDLGMDARGVSLAAFELALTAELDMAAAGRSVGAFELALMPGLDMAAVGVGGFFTRDLELALTPSLEIVCEYTPELPPLYIVDTSAKSVLKWDGSALTTVVSSGLTYPFGVACDAAGDVYIADYLGKLIRKWNGSTTSTVASLSGYPSDVAIDATGTIYATVDKALVRVDGSTPTTLATSPNYLVGIAISPAGEPYVIDIGAKSVLKWDGSALATVVSSGLNSPNTGVAFDELGGLYIADLDGGFGVVLKWDGSALTTAISAAFGLGSLTGMTFSPAGDLYMIDATHKSVLKWDGSALTTVVGSGLASPNDLAFGPA